MMYSIKELRQKTKEIVDLAENGRNIVITYRGNKKAKIVPLQSKHEKTNLGFGIWSDRADITDSSDYVKSIRKGGITW